MPSREPEPLCLRCSRPYDDSVHHGVGGLCRGYINVDMVRERALLEMGDAFVQFSRNGRWGTCSGCPRDLMRRAYPEFCEFTTRYDHQFTAKGLAESYEIQLNMWKRER